MRLAVDLSSTMWSCLLTGKDIEGREAQDEMGKVHWVNTHMYAYEFAVNSIKSALDTYNLTPSDMILVVEGMNSKAQRLFINKDYKANRGKRPNESYEEFAKLKDLLLETFKSLGAIAVKQDAVEADDMLAWLAKHTKEDLVIMSNDNDLLALAGKNEHGAVITARIGGEENYNKYGLFPLQYVTLYKALVGDSGDNIKGITGFGDAAWKDFHAQFGEDGMAEMVRLAKLGSLQELEEDAAVNKLVKKIYDGREQFLNSWRLASLHPEWVNRLSEPLVWMPGMVTYRGTDERLRHWGAASRLVTSENYSKALAFLKAKVHESPYFVVDLETSTSEESDEWLAQSGLNVDVIDSRITGGSITFGSNMQYCYYITVEHANSDNVTKEQFADMYAALDPNKLCVAHNAAGFEIPVLFMEFGELWKSNGWRGFMPNMVDSRIAANYWNENEFSFGLKQLSKKLLGYEQQTYAEVTQGRKMNQVPATEVLDYGCDDGYTSGALWNFFKLFMELEGTYKAFMEYEQKPMYLQATGYVKGIKLDMGRLAELSNRDAELAVENRKTVDEFLLSVGWDGTVCPTYKEVNAANVKEAVLIISGQELKTAIRTPAKLAPLVAAMGFDGSDLLAKCVESNDLDTMNRLVASRFKGAPELNTGSPKQMQKLLYETLGLPVRLRNKATEVMRKQGIREGTARTDEDAILMAIKQGDVDASKVGTLKALIELKSISTRKGLYWDAYPKFLHHRTNRIHPEFRQSSTNTRRYTGANPNLQQMDSDPSGVRSTILPHKKNAVILSLDESSQEVRTMADLCKDEALLACYVGTKDQLRDVHSLVGAQILGIEYEDFRTKLKSSDEAVAAEFTAVRQKAKMTLFALLYGAGAPKIAEGLSITVEEAQAYIDAIYARFPRVLEWKEGVENTARTEGVAKIYGGTIRHLASLISSADTYTASKALRQAGNSSIQSACASQVKRILSRIWDSRLLDDYDYHFYFSLHDETVHSVAVDDAVEVTRILHGFMTEQFLSAVPSASSIGVGKAYAPLVEIGEEFDEEKLKEAIAKVSVATL
jgi:DNA polymerase I-like protein with 3'-5' exonuclease and polymerase domains/5'-3' exonuclease